MAVITVKDGTSTLLWKDNWLQTPLMDQFPHLYSFAKNKNISVSKAFSQQSLQSLFNLPLSVEAHQQFLQVQSFIEHFPLINGNDSWATQGGVFKVTWAYKQLLGPVQVDPVYRHLWKSPCQPKHKVFFWLLISDRLSTRNLLRRRRMALPAYTCVLCQLGAEETLEHLFFNCQFSVHCWASCGITMQNCNDPFQALNQVQNQADQNFFLPLMILQCWSIWSVRNDFIFKAIPPTLQRVKECLLKELQFLALRVKVRLSTTFELWVQNLL